MMCTTLYPGTGCSRGIGPILPFRWYDQYGEINHDETVWRRQAGPSHGRAQGRGPPPRRAATARSQGAGRSRPLARIGGRGRGLQARGAPASPDRDRRSGAAAPAQARARLRDRHPRRRLARAGKPALDAHPRILAAGRPGVRALDRREEAAAAHGARRAARARPTAQVAAAALRAGRPRGVAQMYKIFTLAESRGIAEAQSELLKAAMFSAASPESLL